jgi:antitoxin CptB
MNTLDRLRWRCRRGMKELDLMLLGFIEHADQGLNNDELQALARLVEYPDDVLLDLLMGRRVVRDRTIAHIIDKIRSTAARKT